jgi:hypothetical protein
MRAPLHRVSTQVVVQFGIGVVVTIALQFIWVTIRGSYSWTHPRCNNMAHLGSWRTHAQRRAGDFGNNEVRPTRA